LLAVYEAAALAVLNPLPLNALLALPQVTPAPLDQFENVTPVGGVVHVAVGVAGHVTLAPPPTVTTVWLIANSKRLQLIIIKSNAFLKNSIWRFGNFVKVFIMLKFELSLQFRGIFNYNCSLFIYRKIKEPLYVSM